MRKIQKRAWLNPKSSHDNGWIKWEAMKTPWGSTLEASFMIADCSRTISLNFDVNDAKQRENQLKKANILIANLVELRNYIEDFELGG